MTRWENKRNVGIVPEQADMRLNDGVVSEKVLRAYRKVSEHLSSIGVEHVVVGGLAVGAWGHPRATKDVDLLVREKDVFEGSIFLTFKPGIPIEADGVAIDYLTVESLKISDLQSTPRRESDAEVVPIEVLVAMKLMAKRSQDYADIVALIKNGADIEGIGGWLKENAPFLHWSRFQFLVTTANEESSR